ncbi:MAG: phage tail protein [Bacteroidales bacterium]|nr:phage tail protein [Bacteroidales bacterium]
MKYPPVAFHFLVSFEVSGSDASFMEVSGIDSLLETITVKEGGENRFHHTLPVRAKYSNLVLKRGMITDSAIAKWCQDAIENLAIKPSSVQVLLLNDQHEPLAGFNFINAWPVKWSISTLDADKSAIVVETLELAYQYFKRI